MLGVMGAKPVRAIRALSAAVRRLESPVTGCHQPQARRSPAAPDAAASAPEHRGSGWPRHSWPGRTAQCAGAGRVEDERRQIQLAGALMQHPGGVRLGHEDPLQLLGA